MNTNHIREHFISHAFEATPNEKIAQDPEAVLEEMTRTRSVFTQKKCGALFKETCARE